MMPGDDEPTPRKTMGSTAKRYLRRRVAQTRSRGLSPLEKAAARTVRRAAGARERRADVAADDDAGRDGEDRRQHEDARRELEELVVADLLAREQILRAVDARRRLV